MSMSSEEEEHERRQQVLRHFKDHSRQYTRKVTAALRTNFPSLSGYWEEIAQEAQERTLRVWLQGRNEPGRSPLPYMKKIARNLAVDAVRSPESPVEDEALLPMFEERGVHRCEVLPPPDPAVCLVLQAITNMKPSKRKTVAERDIRGDDEDSIAVDLKIPRDQVRSLRSKAFRDIRDMEEIKVFIRQEHHKKNRRGEEDA
ncbi:RNA polymerase sigma factor [Streptomyces sp. NPDC056492]|uniref:RNA polymerase sigma factor n=1 Tax=unclassified Streptomyces TaxID=2593676 RepID=UPI003674EC70